MTPVEIFKPYYAEALAKYMVSVIQAKGQYEYFHPNNPFRIVEVGGGNGTCAKGILDYIQKHHESLYENTQYEIIDVSKSFHEKQKELLQVHSKRVKLVNERYLCIYINIFIYKLIILFNSKVYLIIKEKMIVKVFLLDWKFLIIFHTIRS